MWRVRESRDGVADWMKVPVRTTGSVNMPRLPGALGLLAKSGGIKPGREGEQYIRMAVVLSDDNNEFAGELAPSPPGNDN